ncbi:hypothetical protein NDU88_003584 [Pleurodeles waltl]|uniref:Uncharacterized protein n=1 Tax=Pleurodeles waltl TaxID=8319 RepID=A0AAV7RFH3_PLEWA|nr:hypothetical protein NDU88_003584 [Pleurodeles waltl]
MSRLVAGATRTPEANQGTRTSGWLSDNAAPGAAETETGFRSCSRDDVTPGCWGSTDARSQPGNPDIRVPKKTTIEDGLCAHGAQEVKNADTEEQEEGDAENKGEDGNSRVPLQTDDRPWEKNNAGKRDICHVPGGTWLKKVRSFIKDSFLKKVESDNRRGEGRGSAGKGEERLWRGQKGEEQD